MVSGNMGVKPPADGRLEKYILGSCLTSNDVLPIVRASLIEDAFFYEANKIVFREICALYDEGKAFDQMVLLARCRKHNTMEAHYIGGLTKDIMGLVSMSYVEESCRLLMNLCNYRRIVKMSTDILNDWRQSEERDSEPLLNIIRETLSGLEKDSVEQRPMTVAEAVAKILEDSKASMKGEGVGSIKTGFPAMDQVFGTWRGGEVHTVAGRPGMGKTEFGCSLSYNVAKTGAPVLFVTYEMKETDLVARIARYHFSFEGSDLRISSLSEKLEQEMTKDEEFRSLPIYTLRLAGDDDLALKRKVRNYCLKYNIKLVLIDYLQRIGERKGLFGEEAVSAKSQAVKTIAMENDVPVVNFAQLSREVEKRDNKRPRLEDLKGSGAIEADSDSVMLMYRPSYYGIDQIGNEFVADKVKMIVAKYRNGKARDITLPWHDGQIGVAKDELPF